MSARYLRTARILCLCLPLVSPLAAPEAVRALGPSEAGRIREIAGADDPDRRREICREILKAKPSPYAQAFCRGYEEIFLGNTQYAELALEEALRLQPDFALGAVLFGEACASLGRDDSAERFLRRAIEIQPQRTDARFDLGSLLLRRGEKEGPEFFPPALEAFRQMTEVNPDSPDGWGNMALVLVHMDRLEDAEAMYRKAIERDPKDPFLYDNLAALFTRRDENDKAEEAWKKALQVNRGYGPAVIELAALYGRTDRLAKAVGVLETGSKDASAPPWGPRIRRNLGFIYLGLGRMPAAQKWLQQAAATSEDALPSLGLGHLWMLEGNVPKAVDAFERGSALDSALAVPFVRAWRTPLRDALPSGETPALHRVLARVESAPPESVRTMAGGAGATGELVALVLEGWSFRDAEQARTEIDGTPPDSTAIAYDTAPEPMQRVMAEYPESAQDAGIEGTVLLVVTINEDGRVTDVRLKESTAPEYMVESAMEAARRWTFRPALRGGTPVRSTILLPFRFATRRK